MAQPATESAPAPAPTPAVEAAQEVASVVEAAPIVETVPKPQPVVAATPGATPLFSLKGALNQPTPQTSSPVQSQTEDGAHNSIDPEAEQKLINNKGAILKKIDTIRTRYTPFFARMEIAQNTITVEVPSKDIANEMLDLWVEIEHQIAAEVGMNGAIVLNPAVKEELRIARPIRLDEKIVHLGEKNPAIQKLVEALGMEVES
ncbi:MAG: hypothetical protein SNH79_03615 [Rikenellaceae bacterium]